MSKSAGGFTTLRDLRDAGHDPVAVRFFLMAGAHYRTRLRLSAEALHAAAEQLRRLREFAERVRRSAPGAAGRAQGARPQEGEDDHLLQRIGEVRAAYREALDDDLNLPQGVGLVFELVREANAALDAERVGARGHEALLRLIDDFDAHLDVVRADEPGLAQEVERLIAEREAARKSRDFALADEIREELRQKGIALEDSKEGLRWRRVR
jgi:cysteinyl-tRNA synthetase